MSNIILLIFFILRSVLCVQKSLFAVVFTDVTGIVSVRLHDYDVVKKLCAAMLEE